MAVVCYIDANAVRAGLVATPAEHEYGSARAFVVGPRPRWLEGEWIERRAGGRTDSGESFAEAYVRAFSICGPGEIQETVELVEARLASARDLDPLDDLIGSTPEEVRRWMERKARLADGWEVGLPVCRPTALSRAIAAHLREDGEWLVEWERSVVWGSERARAGLLHEVCSAPLARIARMQGLSVWKTTRRVELHRELVRSDGGNGERVARIAHDAVNRRDPRE